MFGLCSNFARGVAVAGAVSLVAMSANAADMYSVPAAGGYKDAGPLWSGFYIGVNGGYGWGNSVNVIDGNSIASVSSQAKPGGGFGGAQIGYVWQRGRLVMGAEADFEGAGIKGSSASSIATGISANGSDELDWLGTVRLRGGITIFDRGLLYATGGLAFGYTKDAIGNGSGSTNNNEVAVGYTVGGGVEYSINLKWSVKGEYQFIDLGSNTYSTNAGTQGYVGEIQANHQYNTVRFGLNYHLTPSLEPLK